MNKNDIKNKIIKNRKLLTQAQVRSIALFGSYARNEQRADSDIDFLVEFKKNSYDNFIGLVFSLEDLFKKEVNVVTPAGLSPYLRPFVLKEAEKIEG